MNSQPTPSSPQAGSSEPVCWCGRCWRRHSPHLTPLPPASLNSDGTVYVHVPMVRDLSRLRFPQGTPALSSCSFAGHTAAEAEAKARAHVERGSEACFEAWLHLPGDLVYPRRTE